MKVRILGKEYSVVYVPKEELPNDHGECFDEALLIKVRKDIAKENQKDTLLHEIIHAIDTAMDIEMSERQVRTVATGLLAVFLENPLLVEELCGTRITDLPKKKKVKSANK